VYRTYLSHPDEKLRFDALVLLANVEKPEALVEIHLQLLEDADARVRRLAVERLQKTPGPGTSQIDKRVRRRLHDPDHRVRQAAVKFFEFRK
jgi:HEAT repeat protein